MGLILTLSVGKRKLDIKQPLLAMVAHSDSINNGIFHKHLNSASYNKAVFLIGTLEIAIIAGNAVFRRAPTLFAKSVKL